MSLLSWNVIMEYYKVPSGNPTSSLKERGLSDQYPGHALIEEQKGIRGKIRMVARWSWAKLLEQEKGEDPGAFRAGTGTRGSWSEMQRSEKVRKYLPDCIPYSCSFLVSSWAFFTKIPMASAELINDSSVMCSVHIFCYCWNKEN